MLSDTWDNWYAANQSRIVQVVGTITETHPALLADATVKAICDSIRVGNEEAAALALSLLAEDPRMPFGMILKSQIARAFRAIASSLNADQRDTLTSYRDKLLRLEYPPRESREFAKLVRQFPRT